MDEAAWKKIPPRIRQSLEQSGVGPRDMDMNGKLRGKKPYTAAGAASMVAEGNMPDMASDTYGVTIAEDDPADELASRKTVVLHNPKDKNPTLTRAHEMEHVLANQGRGAGSSINGMWEKTRDKEDAKRGEMVARLLAAAPYLQKEWGLDVDSAESGYFSGAVKSRPDMKNFLYEQMATLSALEQAKNKSLTDDPYMREHVFRTPGERETYNALTGLRQTRLDAKDIAPYTRVAEKPTPVPKTKNTVSGLLASLFGKK